MIDQQRLRDRIARNQEKIETLAALVGKNSEVDERIARLKRVKLIQEKMLGLLMSDQPQD